MYTSLILPHPPLSRRMLLSMTLLLGNLWSLSPRGPGQKFTIRSGICQCVITYPGHQLHRPQLRDLCLKRSMETGETGCAGGTTKGSAKNGIVDGTISALLYLVVLPVTLHTSVRKEEEMLPNLGQDLVDPKVTTTAHPGHQKPKNANTISPIL